MPRNRINNLPREDRDGASRGGKLAVERDERRIIVERVLGVFAPYQSNADGTIISRMAWLYCNIENDSKAKEIVREGLRRYPDNDHFLRFADRLR